MKKWLVSQIGNLFRAPACFNNGMDTMFMCSLPHKYRCNGYDEKWPQVNVIQRHGQWAVAVYKQVLTSLIIPHPPPSPRCPWFFFFFGCLILNCNVFSRRLSSSALSNPSWQSSPSSCRPLANITMGTLSEQHHMSFFSMSFFMYCTHPCHCRQACFAVWKQFANGDNYITSWQN